MTKEELWFELNKINCQLDDLYALIIAGLGGQERMFDAASSLCEYMSNHMERLSVEAGRLLLRMEDEKASA